MMNKTVAIKLAKFAGAFASGIVVGVASIPAVKKVFKLEKAEEVDQVPSEDLEETEVSAEE